MPCHHRSLWMPHTVPAIQSSWWLPATAAASALLEVGLAKAVATVAVQDWEVTVATVGTAVLVVALVEAVVAEDSVAETAIVLLHRYTFQQRSCSDSGKVSQGQRESPMDRLPMTRKRR